MTICAAARLLYILQYRRWEGGAEWVHLLNRLRAAGRRASRRCGRAWAPTLLATPSSTPLSWRRTTRSSRPCWVAVRSATMQINVNKHAVRAAKQHLQMLLVLLRLLPTRWHACASKNLRPVDSQAEHFLSLCCVDFCAGYFHDNVYCHVASGLGAGFVAVCVGSPVDVLKSRMMGAWPVACCACCGEARQWQCTSEICIMLGPSHPA